VSASLEDYREFYAEEIRAVASLRSEALARAFAAVPREDFLGVGPWKIASFDAAWSAVPRYIPTADADPRRLYHNVLIAIDEARSLNNGQPSALAAWLDALEIREGERAVHVGAGVGYYSAIMADVVSPRGSVVAIEVDAELAARARENLKRWKNVEVVAGDGACYDFGPADAIFVNAGVTHPSRIWLDQLNPQGRLLYPLTFEAGGAGGKGCMILVKRDIDAYSARATSFVAIYSCAALRDPDLNTALVKQMSSGKITSAQSLRRDAHAPDDTCIAHAKDSCLSQRAPTSPLSPLS
jgi:protein-L-isoaspartate(D-aspartate) O-methyltransferase